MTETKEDFFEMANLFPDDAWEPRPSPMLRSVADWIRLNEAALVDYWEYRISTAQFIRHCEPCRQAEHSRSRLCSAKPVRALTSKLSRYLDNSSQPLQAALGKSGCES